jgi:hypothetical protein
VHGGADDGGAAVVGQVVVGGGGDEGADDGDAERRAELLGDVVERARRTRVARIDTLLPDRDRRDDGRAAPRRARPPGRRTACAARR